MQPSTVFLMIIVFVDLLSFLQGVSVKYPRDPVNEIEGRSWTLKCRVQYETRNCWDIETNWCLFKKDDCEPLTDPQRYMVKINETDERQHRHRDIFLIFTSLILEDTGLYQCNAKCLHSGTEAKGHVISFNVTADPYKGLPLSNWSGQCKINTAVLILSGIIFFWNL